MNGIQNPGSSGFSLETDDRTDEERSRDKWLNVGTSEEARAPMDSDYQEEMEPAKPKIKFNLNFDKKIRDVKESEEERDRKRFDIRRLFEAVASGDVMRLDGLHQYLHKSLKKLTNSEYQSYGKNALMKALLNLKDGKNNTVEFLLDISEKMGDIKEFVNAAYTESNYQGQTALHVAIERRSLYYVQLLMQRGAGVHAKACGTFFQPHDGPSFYFGELPLSLAASTNQTDVVNFLMENEFQRADPREQDAQGNTVLHALVVIADNTRENTDFITGMYDHLLTTTARLYPKWKLEDIENNWGLTPIKLAARTGKIGLFGHILQREFPDCSTKHLSRKFTEWVYGPVHSSLYDLASLDSFEDNSVLQILVYGSDIPNRHEMLQIEPLNRLLEEKWTRFARQIFFFQFLVYVCYLIVFTLVSYNKREGQPPFPVEHTTEGYLYLSGQLLTTLASCYFFIRGIVDMRRKHPKLQTLLIDGYWEMLFLLQAVLFLVSAVLYCCGRLEYLGFLVVCLALSWINLLYFARGFKNMGIYSVMIQTMILSDILRFLFVYVVFLIGFSAAVVTLLIEPPSRNDTTSKEGRIGFYIAEEEPCQRPTYRNISFTTLELFKFTIGMGDLEFTEKYQYKEVFYVLLISYIVLTYILLLNMLIALMSRTVEQISKESTSIWKLQRAITILDLESGLPHRLRKRFRCGVQKILGLTAGEESRRCFRVEEVNWNKWNINLGIIQEDPGEDAAWVRGTASHSSPATGRGWRGFLGGASRRYSQPRHRHGHQMHTELRPLSTTPITPV